MGTVRPTTEARVKATAEVHAAIVAEAPVSNLVTPSWHVGLSDRVKDYKPYGSDYYVVRADLFVVDKGAAGPLKLGRGVRQGDIILSIILYYPVESYRLNSDTDRIIQDNTG